MMFDARNGAVERKLKLIGVSVVLLWLTAVSAIIYVAAHFVIKYW